MMIKLLAKYMYSAPEFLDLMRALVKDEVSGIILRRNQLIVAKAIMGAPRAVIKDMESNKNDRLALHLLGFSLCLSE